MKNRIGKFFSRNMPAVVIFFCFLAIILVVILNKGAGAHTGDDTAVINWLLTTSMMLP